MRSNPVPTPIRRITAAILRHSPTASPVRRSQQERGELGDIRQGPSLRVARTRAPPPRGALSPPRQAPSLLVARSPAAPPEVEPADRAVPQGEGDPHSILG